MVILYTGGGDIGYTRYSIEILSNFGPSSYSVRFNPSSCVQSTGYRSLAHFSTSSFQYSLGIVL